MKSDFVLDIKSGFRKLTSNRIVVSYGVPFVIFFTTIGFKLIFWSDYGFWYDEIFSVFHSQDEFSKINDVAKWDVHPPFYYYLVHYWMQLFGNSEFAIRSLSLLFNGLAVTFAYLFSKKFFNQQTAIYSFILFFSSDVFFFYAQEARTYSLLFFLYIICSWSFFNLIKKERVIDMILLGVINYMIISTHYIEGIIMLFQVIILIITFKKKTGLYYLISCLITAGLLNFLIPRLFDVFLGGGNNIVAAPNIGMILDVSQNLLNNSMLLIWSFLIILMAGLIFFFKNSYEYDKKKLLVLYLFLTTFLSHIIMFVLSFKAPMYGTRYLLFTLPLFYIMVAYSASQIRLNNWVKIIIFFFLGGFSLTTINYDINKGMDYKRAVPFIKSRMTEQTIVVLQSRDVSALFAYYYDQRAFKDFTRLSHTLREQRVFTVNTINELGELIQNKPKRIILVQTFQQFPDPKGEVKAYFQNNYVLKEVNNYFDGVDISAYELE